MGHGLARIQAASEVMRGKSRMPKKKLDITVQISGQKWRIISDHRLPRDTDGDCNASLRRIRIHPSHPPEKRLELVVHESGHAAFDHLDEQYVDQFGVDMVGVLLHPDMLAFLGLQRIPETPRAR